MRRFHLLTAGAITLLATSAASAQLPSASTRALGMGDNFTAIARGYAAVSWNPAMLGLPGNPGFSLALLPIRGIAGLGPVELKDLKDYQGQFVPGSVREIWLQSIESQGNEEGTGGGDATFVAAQIGRIGFQLATSVRAVGDLSPGAAEILLFGNAGRTGQPRALDLNGSRIDAHGASSFGLSYGFPIARSAAGQTSIGITAKYTVGNLLLIGRDQNSTITDAPAMNVNFPVVGTSTDNFNANGGSGFGLDIGFATRHGKTTVGAAIKNVVNTFKWDETKLRYREGTATFDANTHESQFDEQPFTAAPANLKQLVDDARFKPTIAAGIGVEANDRLTLSADVRTRVGDTSMQDDPKMHAGVGAELRVIPLLPIRVGAALQTGGYQIGGGLGLNLGPLNLAASVVSRKTDLGTDVISMFTLLSTIGR